MKGITPVIALILLLVIVIVVVGFSFGIFQSIISTAGGAAEEQAGETTGRITQTVVIESIAVSGDSISAVSVRNQGNQIDDADTVGIYVKGEKQVCSSWSDEPILAGRVSTCSFDATACATDDEVRVTSPSGAVATETC